MTTDLRPEETVPATMRRFRLAGRRRLVLEDGAVLPRPGEGEVLVKVAACTICNRSDLVYYHYLGEREHCGTGCFGHEIAGTVAAVGAGVTGLEPGRRVFVRTPLTSGFAEYAVARQISVGLLPDDVPFEHGAILQLLPLAVHATRGVRLGDRVAVIGQGPVGLMALQVALLRGAVDVVVADLDPWRLDRSRLLGAHRTVRVADRPGELDKLGTDFDVAVDAVGTPHTANAAVAAVRQNGLVVLLGTHHVDTHVTFDLVAWEKKGLRVHSSAEPTDVARQAALGTAQRLIDHRRILLADLLSDVVPLTGLPAAIERLSANRLLYPAAEHPPFAGPPAQVLKVAVCP